MPSRFNQAKALALLPCIVYCASCAPQTCIRCSLSCDGEPELKQLKSVHVRVEHQSVPVLDKTFSSLYDGGHCSVPGCFQRDEKYTLEIYTHDNATHENERVLELLYKTIVQPDCGPEGISDRSSE
ncbi:unnamed protein product [Leuciscus chuanchicus]